MPRIDPKQLLATLSVLLTRDGGIKSRDEVPRIVQLMQKFSKKLVSKCVYIHILRSSAPDLLELFLNLDGWELLNSWFLEAYKAQDYYLCGDLMKLFALCPMTPVRLRENPEKNQVPKMVRQVANDLKFEAEIRNLSLQILQQWMTVARAPLTVAEKTLAAADVLPGKKSVKKAVVKKTPGATPTPKKKTAVSPKKAAGKKVVTVPAKKTVSMPAKQTKTAAAKRAQRILSSSPDMSEAESDKDQEVNGDAEDDGKTKEEEVKADPVVEVRSRPPRRKVGPPKRYAKSGAYIMGNSSSSSSRSHSPVEKAAVKAKFGGVPIVKDEIMVEKATVKKDEEKVKPKGLPLTAAEIRKQMEEENSDSEIDDLLVTDSEEERSNKQKEKAALAAKAAEKPASGIKSAAAVNKATKPSTDGESRLKSAKERAEAARAKLEAERKKRMREKVTNSTSKDRSANKPKPYSRAELRKETEDSQKKDKIKELAAKLKAEKDAKQASGPQRPSIASLGRIPKIKKEVKPSFEAMLGSIDAAAANKNVSPNSKSAAKSTKPTAAVTAKASGGQDASSSETKPGVKVERQRSYDEPSEERKAEQPAEKLTRTDSVASSSSETNSDSESGRKEVNSDVAVKAEDKKPKNVKVEGEGDSASLAMASANSSQEESSTSSLSSDSASSDADDDKAVKESTKEKVSSRHHSRSSEKRDRHHRHHHKHSRHRSPSERKRRRHSSKDEDGKERRHSKDDDDKERRKHRHKDHKDRNGDRKRCHRHEEKSNGEGGTDNEAGSHSEAKKSKHTERRPSDAKEPVKDIKKEEKPSSNVATPERKPKEASTPPPKKKASVLKESNMFGDVLTSIMKESEQQFRKRKRKLSESKAEKDNSRASSAKVTRTEDDAKNKEPSLTTAKEDANSSEDSVKEDGTLKEASEPAKPKEIKGILVLARVVKSKRRITWKPDDKLVEVEYFEMDENERHNVFRIKSFEEMKKKEMQFEKYKMAQGPNTQSEEEEKPWKLVPIALTLDVNIEYGKESQEKEVQRERESRVLRAIFCDGKDPSEPDSLPRSSTLNKEPSTEPKAIPQIDLSGRSNDSTHDFSADGHPVDNSFVETLLPPSSSTTAASPSVPNAAGKAPEANINQLLNLLGDKNALSSLLGNLAKTTGSGVQSSQPQLTTSQPPSTVSVASSRTAAAPPSVSGSAMSNHPPPSPNGLLAPAAHSHQHRRARRSRRSSSDMLPDRSSPYCEDSGAPRHPNRLSRDEDAGNGQDGFGHPNHHYHHNNSRQNDFHQRNHHHQQQQHGGGQFYDNGGGNGQPNRQDEPYDPETAYHANNLQQWDGGHNFPPRGGQHTSPQPRFKNMPPQAFGRHPPKNGPGGGRNGFPPPGGRGRGGAKSTRPCRYWNEFGECNKGDRCGFAHIQR